MKYAILIDAGFLSQTEPLDVTGVRAFLDALRAEMLEHLDLVLDVPTGGASAVPTGLVASESVGADARA
jgi:hypothetical protein